MFFKKEEARPPIAYIHISFNITALREWFAKPVEVGVENKWANEESQITHSIDLLVNDDLYYHRDANQFSHTIAGSHFVDQEIGPIEWRIIDKYLFVVLEYHELIPCIFPLDDIQLLLKHGRTSSNDPIKHMKDGEIITLEMSDEYCKKIKKTTWLSYGLIYSNDIASLHFSIPSGGHSVDYSETNN